MPGERAARQEEPPGVARRYRIPVIRRRSSSGRGRGRAPQIDALLRHSGMA